MKKINVVIYGATGSIGRSTLSIISKNLDKINIEGITCNKNIFKLLKIAKTYNVKKIGFNEKSIHKLNKFNLNKYEVFNDDAKFYSIISKKTDVIIFAASGLSSLDLLLKILKSGKIVGIANKECIITLGKKFISLSKKFKTKIIPLDSEHNSIYHLLSQNLGKYKSITITATGGPFLHFTKNKMSSVKPQQAIRHPVWNMGSKISIDSATMMNKALEIIEAKYLFNLKNNEINAIIHPQAIIHALINYENGISTALLNKPDMRVPISSLFFGFNKYSNVYRGIELTNYSNFEFIPIDKNKFPAVELGYQVMKVGGLAPHIFNYLNEILVNLFINKRIKFLDIVKLNEVNMDKFFGKNSNIANPKLKDIKNINNWIDNNLYVGN